MVCHIRACFDALSLVLACSSASFSCLDLYSQFYTLFQCHPGISPWNWKLTLLILGIDFKRCLNGGCKEKKLNARYSQHLQTATGRRTSFKTVPPPRDRLSLGGQRELISWWLVPDHIHGTNSTTPMSRYNRLVLAVTWNIIFGDYRGIVLGSFLSWF